MVREEEIRTATGPEGMRDGYGFASPERRKGLIAPGDARPSHETEEAGAGTGSCCPGRHEVSA